MNRPEFETQEEWRNGILTFPAHWWQEVDWVAIAFVVSGVITGNVIAWLIWGLP